MDGGGGLAIAKLGACACRPGLRYGYSHRNMHCDSSTTFPGFVFIYLLGQTSMWGLIHGIFLLWAVRDPFGFRRLKKTGRIRYAHIICVAMAVVLPLVAPCALLRDGYINTATPSQVCVGRSFSVTYYALILPVSFIVGLTSCLLSLFFWTLFKVYIYLTMRPLACDNYQGSGVTLTLQH